MQLDQLIKIAGRKLVNTGQVSNSKFWQGNELKNPLFQAIKVYLGPAIMPETMQDLNTITGANQPWAEDHFKERISGKPVNPGETYKTWPFYGQDKNMRTEGEKFTHTYMERFWPKFAGYSEDRYLPQDLDPVYTDENANQGIRYRYGDLNDVISLIARDPETRQAFLPVWFPEDTGAVHKGRVPCTLGYLFQIVNEKLHMTYYIRSCDYYRHFKDDIYHAVRLAQHLLLHLRILDNRFNEVTLGLFDMHVGSLHIFNAEVNKLNKEINPIKNTFAEPLNFPE